MKNSIEPIIEKKILEILALSICDIKDINKIRSGKNDIILPYSTNQNPGEIENFSFNIKIKKLPENFKYILSFDISGNGKININGMPDQAIDAGHKYTIFNDNIDNIDIKIGTRELFGKNSWQLYIKSIKLLTINYNMFINGLNFMELYKFATALNYNYKNNILKVIYKNIFALYESPNIKQIIGLNSITDYKNSAFDFLSDVYGYPIMHNDISDFKIKNVDYDSYHKIFQGTIDSINNTIDNNGKIFAFGHCHIDAAWLWPYSETVRKVERSFLNVSKLYDMGFNFSFAQSSALYYSWIESKNKQLFSKIRELIKNNQWVPVGGMWVESDTNLIRGESLARQLLYGQKYFMEKFGKYAKIGWLPDTFGFSGQLPQLFIKSSIETFVTHKPMWNDTTEFPYHCFIWKGIDGTGIVTNIVNSTYNGDLGFDSIIKSWNKFKNKEFPMTYLYGYGDGGGGPNIEMLLRLEESKKAHFLPDMMNKPSENDYVNNMELIKNKLPEYNGEIYLENHRGVYTTNFGIKNLVSKLEDKLNMLEFIDFINYLHNKNLPEKNIKTLWYTLLTAEFHDILPGSADYDAYNEVFSELYKLENHIDMLTDLSIKTLIKNNEIKHGLIAINSSQYDFNDYIELPDKIISKNIDYITAGDTKFIKCNIPHFGYKIISNIKNNENIKFNFRNGIYEIENNIIKLRIFNNGYISIYDIKNNKSIIKMGNIMAIYNDIPSKFDAWNINYLNIKSENYMKCIDTKINVLSKNIIGIIEIKKTFEDLSTISQKIIIKPLSEIIEFENEIHMNNREKLAKILFNPSFKASYIKREIPFGNIIMHIDSKTEKTHFEFPALRWIDYSNEKYGFSIISRESHGYSYINKNIGISIGKFPLYPNPYSDMNGYMEKFYLYIHEKDFDIYKKTVFIFNNIKLFNNKLNGKNSSVSFMDINNNGIILESTKISEDNNGIIARFYNSENKHLKLKLKFDKNIDFYETNILEDNNVLINSENIEFKPFEIKTLLFKIKL